MRNACIAVCMIQYALKGYMPPPPPPSLFPHGLQQWQLLVCHCRRMSALSCSSLTFRLLYDADCGYLNFPLTGYDISFLSAAHGTLNHCPLICMRDIRDIS